MQYTKLLSMCFCCSIFLLGCNKFESPKNISPSQKYITGLENSVMYSYQEASQGQKYSYQSNGRKFIVNLAFIQNQVFYTTSDESKNTERLDPVGFLDEQSSSVAKYQIILGQHDFDSDGTDELVIAMIDPTDAIAMNIYKLRNNLWLKVPQSPEIAVGYLAKPNAILKGNTVKINRYFRGFWRIWTLESGIFIGALDVDENYSTSNR